jgi:2-polyprenyl-3-methyl-5-hydroxy-6-metoxy-1,4-benzoquinol methylase
LIASAQYATFKTPQGSVEAVPLPNGKLRVTLKANTPDLFIPRKECETSLPIDVVEAFIDVNFAWLCDSLARHEDPDYVQRVLRNQLLAYVDLGDFRGKRLLDFGCGSGASAMFMGALLPDAEIVGVELDKKCVDLARLVLAARGMRNVTFERSPHGKALPSNIGAFDFVMLSAVYEHLLPEERRIVVPLLWNALRPGGLLFINQTPYRYFPYEHHSTGLWLINYLPDKTAQACARRFSKRNNEINQSPDWSVHLRGGIRGGTEGEILRILRESRACATIAQPKNQDRASYWLSCTDPSRHRLIKKSIAALFRVTDRLFGAVPSTNMDVVFRKEPA